MNDPRAFPSNAIDDKFGGMGLWDYHAGQALTGIIASCCAPGDSWPTSQQAAEAAARFADAMMAEREKRRAD